MGAGGPHSRSGSFGEHNNVVSAGNEPCSLNRQTRSLMNYPGSVITITNKTKYDCTLNAIHFLCDGNLGIRTNLGYASTSFVY